MASTNKELADLLTERNQDGRYDQLINECKNYNYHDFKTIHATPKLKLVTDLRKFPELEDITAQVMDGVFDETFED